VTAYEDMRVLFFFFFFLFIIISAIADEQQSIKEVNRKSVDTGS
jgi:hypothetical protein